MIKGERQYTQVLLVRKQEKGKTKPYKKLVGWLPSELVGGEHFRLPHRINGEDWLVKETYSSMRASLVEKFPKDFRLLVSELLEP